MAERRRVRGEGSIYQRESDGRWVGVMDLGWVGGKRVRRTVTARTLKELRPKFRRLKEQVEKGVLGEDATVAEWLDYWMAEVAPRTVRPRTLQGYAGYVETWLKPHLGRRKLTGLKPDHIRALHKVMEQAGKSDATRRQAHMILQRALKVAMMDQRILSNPAERMERPPVGKGKHASHSTVEAKAVIQRALEDGNVGLTVRLMLAYLAAMRQGEVLALRWDDVDLEDAVAHVHHSLARLKGQGLVVGEVKSSASDRFVPLVEPLVVALDAWRAQTGGRGFVFGEEEPVNPRADWQVWKDALRAAGVTDVPLHGARATCASLLSELGCSERLIADILGHAQVSTTQKHYIRTDDRQRREALDRASRALLGGTP